MGRVYLFIFIAICSLAIGQKNCHSFANENNSVNEFQTLKTEEDNSIITIPIVVHVLFNNSSQNISDDEIQSQISRLNLDFRGNNADSLETSHPFYPYFADTKIKFCLASKNPFGGVTTGITRTYTNIEAFSYSAGNIERLKQSQNGGIDNWDPKHYLNIWVCNLGDGIYGFSSFPNQLATQPNNDGVVINYRYFGNDVNINKGRTLVHEVGHWLGLRHLWGDEFCGDDNIGDTPPQENENTGCPSFPNKPNNNCMSDEKGEMYMNYMDYTNDACMRLFTPGQKSTMRQIIYNYRIGLATNDCENVLSFHERNHFIRLKTYPNPVASILYIDFGVKVKNEINLMILNSDGHEVMKMNHNEIQINEKVLMMNIEDIPSGIYFLCLKTDNYISVKRLVKI